MSAKACSRRGKIRGNRRATSGNRVIISRNGAEISGNDATIPTNLPTIPRNLRIIPGNGAVIPRSRVIIPRNRVTIPRSGATAPGVPDTAPRNGDTAGRPEGRVLCRGLVYGGKGVKLPLAMTAQHLTEEYGVLPPEAQRQVDDFVEFLRQKYASVSTSPTPELEEEPFIGMWRGRDDLEESSAQVRELRKTEWGEA